MDVNETFSGDHFMVYTHIKALCYTPEMNVRLSANYISILKSKMGSGRFENLSKIYISYNALAETPPDREQVSGRQDLHVGEGLIIGG